ncbi:MAG: hypothetical protein QM691_04985 [Opitutaceae bacterium]
MKPPTYVASLMMSLLVLGAVSPLGAATKPTKPKTLLDFREQDVERNGAEITEKKRYGYSFGDWQGKITFLEGRGLLVPFVVNKGGFGGDKSLKLADYNAVELVATIGNRNEATTFGLTLTDADGTEATWYLPLADRPRGAEQIYHLDLARCDKEEKPGGTPGLDKAKIKKWQVKAGWQEKKIELLVVRLDAVP